MSFTFVVIGTLMVVSISNGESLFGHDLGLPGAECGRRLPSNIKPSELGDQFCAYIKNVRFREYLYSPDGLDKHVFTRKDKSYGHPCTWGSQSPVARPVGNEGLWRFVSLKSGSYTIETVDGRRRFLYADFTHPQDSRRLVGISENLEGDAMEWRVEFKYDNIVRMRNEASNEYFYATGTTNSAYEDLRNVFTRVGKRDVENWRGKADWILEYAQCPPKDVEYF